MTTARIQEFLATRRPPSPCLVVDLDVVRDNYCAFRKALPDSRVFYAVKAKPAPEILRLLETLGSSFDTASVAEIEMALNAGATPDRISFGNTIKKERDIARAHELGIFRSLPSTASRKSRRSGRAAPGARVFCRVLTSGEGAEWPLVAQVRLRSGNGCRRSCAGSPASASIAYGVSFHVGSQMTDTGAWDKALADARMVFEAMADKGITLMMVNLGGGFPARYLKDVPSAEAYGRAIFDALRKHFGNRIPETIIEPGRGYGRQCRCHQVGGRSRLEEVRQRQYPLGLSRHRQVRRPRGDNGRGDPLQHHHAARRRHRRALRARRPDLRQRRRAL